MTDPNRITGPAGVRIIAPAPGGFWRISHESGPTDSDPLEETRAEALQWATEIVNAKGALLHVTPQRVAQPTFVSPNERPDALAKATPKPGDVVGHYEYSKTAARAMRSRR